MMTTSPTPWSYTAEGIIIDFLGNAIGGFNDHRDAECICVGLTDEMRDLKEEAERADSEWEHADACVQHLDGLMHDIQKILKSEILTVSKKFEDISAIVEKYINSPDNYAIIDKRT